MKLAFIFIMLISINSYGDSFICFDKHQSFAIEAPNGWVADYKKGEGLGACVVYYLKGETFDSSPAIIYPVLAGMKESGTNAIKANIALNTKKLKSRKSSLKVTQKKSITNSSGLRFDVHYFSEGPAPQEYEAVGYHGVKKAVLLAVYSARNKANFKKHLEAHREFLMSIKPMPKVKVKIK